MNRSSYYTTEHFYKEVISKVTDQSREYFIQNNINEEVLVELKKLWCDKLTSSGIFTQNNRTLGFIARQYPSYENNFKDYSGIRNYQNEFISRKSYSIKL